MVNLSLTRHLLVAHRVYITLTWRSPQHPHTGCNRCHHGHGTCSTQPGLVGKTGTELAVIPDRELYEPFRLFSLPLYPQLLITVCGLWRTVSNVEWLTLLKEWPRLLWKHMSGWKAVSQALEPEWWALDVNGGGKGGWRGHGLQGD